MRAFGLAVLGVLAYCVFLAAGLPAALVAERLAQESRGAVRLEDARGTAWRGEGLLRVDAAALGRVSWRWRPASLAAGRLGFSLHVDEPALKAAAELGRGLGAWEVRDLAAQGRAEVLAGALPLLAPWRPQGELELRAPVLSWTPAALGGEARIEWRHAALGLSDVRPLGHYRAELRGDGANARVTLATLQGPLQLSGSGTLDARGRLDFRGQARAEGPQAPALQPLLDLLGPRNPDGSHALGAPSGRGVP